MIFTKKIEKGEIFFYFDMIGKIPAYLPLRCYSNRAGSSVRIFETYFDEKEGTAFADITEEKKSCIKTHLILTQFHYCCRRQMLQVNYLHHLT